MSNVYNKTTHEIRLSANTPDYPTADWLINPDLSGVTGVPRHYRKLVGDVPTEMTAGEKATVDATAVAADLAARKAEALALVGGGGDGVNRVMRAAFETIINGIQNDTLNSTTTHTIDDLEALVRNKINNP